MERNIYYQNVHENANIFNKVLINVFSNFIPNKSVNFFEQDPPWMNELVKRKNNWKNEIYKTYIKMVALKEIISKLKMQLMKSQKS